MSVSEKTRRLTADAVLLAVALILATVERWIPLELIIPVPGVKLGLANIVTLFVLAGRRSGDALMILVLRCLIVGSFAGLTTLLFSLAGGLLAWGIMLVLMRWEGRAFSLIGISLAGAAAHNIGQVLAAVLVLGDWRLLVTYLPPLLLTGLSTGTLTGVAAIPLITRFPDISLMAPAPGPAAPSDPKRGI